jgi:bifunctional phosphoglucose/phosphomannose isomerase
MALAYVCLPLLIVLIRLGLAKGKSSELNETVFLLKKSQRHLEEKGKELALKLAGKMPVIYVPEELKAVASRFCKELNENSKQFAASHFVPEQNHNEINAVFGLTRKNSHFLLLRNNSEEAKIAKRFGFLHKILRKNFDVTEVRLEGKSKLATAFYAIQLAAMTSYYLALLNKRDPDWIPVIKELKKELKRK